MQQIYLQSLIVKKKSRHIIFWKFENGDILLLTSEMRLYSEAVTIKPLSNRKNGPTFPDCLHKFWIYFILRFTYLFISWSDRMAERSAIFWFTPQTATTAGAMLDEAKEASSVSLPGVWYPTYSGHSLQLSQLFSKELQQKQSSCAKKRWHGRSRCSQCVPTPTLTSVSQM